MLAEEWTPKQSCASWDSIQSNGICKAKKSKWILFTFDRDTGLKQDSATQFSQSKPLVETESADTGFPDSQTSKNDSAMRVSILEKRSFIDGCTPVVENS